MSNVFVVPGWTLLPDEVDAPPLTRLCGLWVVDCVPAPEPIDKSAIAHYCKARFDKIIH